MTVGGPGIIALRSMNPRLVMPGSAEPVESQGPIEPTPGGRVSGYLTNNYDA
jgi:hypothetical protein